MKFNPILKALLIFTTLSTQAQTVAKDSSFVYYTPDSTFTLTITIPQFTGMADKKKEKKLNEFIWKSIMLPETEIQSTLEENEYAGDDLDSLQEVGEYIHNENGRTGYIQLLLDNFLCLKISDSYYYYGAMHGSSNPTFINVDLTTFKEISLNKFFLEEAASVFGDFERENFNEASEDLQGIVTWGITDQYSIDCTGCYCVVFCHKGIASGYGYAENEICLENFKGTINKKYQRIFRCKKSQ